MNLSRRSFLKAAALSGVAATLPRLPIQDRFGDQDRTIPLFSDNGMGVTKMFAWVPITEEALQDNYRLSLHTRRLVNTL